MDREAKQEQAYWAYQAKMENRQRMIDKGWGDKEDYKKVMAEEAKRAKIQRWKNKANEIIVGILMVALIIGLLFLKKSVFHLPFSGNKLPTTSSLVG